MHGASSEILWALSVGSAALLALILLFIASVVFSRRRFVSVEREKLNALHDREERFRSIIENSSDAIALLNPEGTVLYASASTRRVIGYDADECVERNFFSFVEPADIDFLRGLLQQCRTSSAPLPTFQFRLRHKTGEVLWAEATAANFLSQKDVEAIVLNYRDITQRKESQEQLELSNNRLRMLTGRLQSIREDEQIRIAREIHDELGGMLTVLKMDVAALERLQPGAEERPLKPKIDMLSDRIDTIIRSVRRIATELRPAVLDEFGLPDAIESELQTFHDRSGMKTIFAGEESFPLDSRRSTALFRIFQETLTNIARHSHATEVHVILSLTEGIITLEVRDNGEGISATALGNIKSLGLLGMTERARSVGGNIFIRRIEPRGTSVKVEIPQDAESIPSEQ